jgi:peptide/nickel transport system permease protein
MTIALNTPTADGSTDHPRAHQPHLIRRVVLGRPSAAIAAGFVLLLIVLAVFAPLISPGDPAVQHISTRFASPSGAHWLGTDSLGRDVLSRLIYATRIALAAPAISVVLAVALGLPTGLIAGLSRGWADTILSRIADALLSLPGLAFALAIVAVLGPGLFHAMLALGVTFAPTVFRIVRSATLSVAQEPYIRAARAIGCSVTRTLRVHVVPNIAAPLLVQTTILMGVALIAEASLSFLGLGVQPPSASWGTMLYAAYETAYQDPFGLFPPGLALMFAVLAFNTVGDSIRDAVGLQDRR